MPNPNKPKKQKIAIGYKELHESYERVLSRLEEYESGLRVRRPISLPAEITPGEYNWFVKYLNEQKERFLNINQAVPDKLEESEPVNEQPKMEVI